MSKGKQFFSRWARKIFNIASKDFMASVVDEVRTDTLALQYLSPLNKDYIPWTKPAMRPGAVASILNDIIVNRRNTILECGAGVSTIFISRLLGQLNRGHLFSIEHDETWIQTLSSLLSSEMGHVTLIHAPLVNCDTIQTGCWYDIPSIKSVLSQTKVDMLIVDGPPSQKNGDLVRYPAVPVLKDLLAENFSLVLDDVNRQGEREILELWKKELKLEFHIVSHAAIGLTSNAYISYV